MENILFYHLKFTNSYQYNGAKIRKYREPFKTKFSNLNKVQFITTGKRNKVEFLGSVK